MKKKNRPSLALINNSKKCPKCRKDFKISMNGNVATIYIHSGISCCIVLDQPD